MSTLKLFVLSHDEEWLQRVPSSPEYEPVNLTALDIGEFQTNMLGECRAFFRDFESETAEYLGFANARWDQKYFKLKTRLDTLARAAHRYAAPGWVLTPWLEPQWYKVTLIHHPTMEPLLQELAALHSLALEPGRLTLWANDFICHRSVFFDWLRFWRETFDHFYHRYGLDLPFEISGTDPTRHSAFFYERFTAAYFANRQDVRVVNLD